MSDSIIQYLNPPSKPGAYVYLFSFDGVPVYVGKGTGRRLFAHEGAARNHTCKTRWQSALARALRKGVAVCADVLGEGLSTAEANALEVCLIDRYGRRDLGTGTLHNRTAGGDGLTREEAIRIFKDPVTRRKLMRARARHGRDALYRVKLALAQRRHWSDPRARERRSAISRAVMARPGVRERMLASCAITNRRPEVQARRSAAARALHQDPGYQLKLYSALRRAANRPERKALAAEQMRERNKDPEFTARRLEGIRKYWQALRAKSER